MYVITRYISTVHTYICAICTTAIAAGQVHSIMLVANCFLLPCDDACVLCSSEQSWHVLTYCHSHTQLTLLSIQSAFVTDMPQLQHMHVL